MGEESDSAARTGGNRPDCLGSTGRAPWHSMSDSTFTVVRSARTAIEADLLIAALRSADFHPLDLNTSGHYTIGGADIAFRVRIPTTELVAAQEFLGLYEAAAVSGAESNDPA